MRAMKSAVRSQRGLTLAGGLGGLLLLVILGTVLVRMGPHYYQYIALDRVISAARTEAATDMQSPADLYRYVEHGMQINGIYGLNLQDALQISQEDGEFQVHLAYEQREPLIANLDLVARFDKEYRFRAP